MARLVIAGLALVYTAQAGDASNLRGRHNPGHRSPGAGGRNPGPRSPAFPRSPDERPRLTTTASPQAPSPQVPRGSEFRWAFDRSYCMSVVDNVFQNGQKMQLWGCAGGSGQYFDYSVPHWGMPALLKVAASPEYCVVIDNNNNYDGAAIQLWECDGAVQAQHWYVDPSGKIVNAAYTDKCLVVDANTGENGQRLQLWSCNGDEQFKTWSQVV